uniref:hypothetical protein n=1 Tax=Serratia marcescens TaxID=615 RepID=UPI00195356FD
MAPAQSDLGACPEFQSKKGPLAAALPTRDRRGNPAAAGTQHIIIVPQPAIIGMPDDIMDIMLLQHSMNMSLD